MQYASIFIAMVAGYLALGLVFLIVSTVQEEKLLRYKNNEQLPPEVVAHLKNAPSVKKTIILWPKAVKWLTKLEDLLKRPSP